MRPYSSASTRACMRWMFGKKKKKKLLPSIIPQQSTLEPSLSPRAAVVTPMQPAAATLPLPLKCFFFSFSFLRCTGAHCRLLVLETLPTFDNL